MLGALRPMSNSINFFTFSVRAILDDEEIEFVGRSPVRSRGIRRVLCGSGEEDRPDCRVHVQDSPGQGWVLWGENGERDLEWYGGGTDAEGELRQHLTAETILWHLFIYFYLKILLRV